MWCDYSGLEEHIELSTFLKLEGGESYGEEEKETGIHNKDFLC